MGRQIDLDDLVSVEDIADRLHLRRIQVVHNWIKRHQTFPAPIKQIGAVRLYYWPDIAAWTEARRLPGQVRADIK